MYEGSTFDDRAVKFTIGEGPDHGIVEGVEVGLQKMNKGEKAQLQLKPKLAFGKEGNKEFN
ncbi:FKBP-type peptidyl-prolyl cis-trans isomerase, partial [Salmonella sp. s55044]|uniref:FKBP-type peptidyl-prolyl cis-trans isomerase n=1 Tax=Salmonella sp. s55044 TaxID=3159677 RepID=UPI00397EE54A